MRTKRISAAAFIGCLSVMSATFAQSPVGDVLQNAVEGARQGAANSINQSVNEALGVPNNVQQNQQWNQQNLRQSVAPNQDGYRIQPNLNDGLRRAGFQPGDVILDQNGRPIQSDDGLNRALNNSNGRLQVQRDGQVIQVGASQQISRQNDQRRLGIQMQQSSNAVIVSQVERDSLAARAGLQANDRIIAINGQNVNDPRSISQRISAVNGSQAVLLIERQGRPMELVVSFDQTSHTQNHSSSHQGDLAMRVQQLEQRVADLQSQLSSIQEEHQRVLDEHQKLMQQQSALPAPAE